MRTINDLANELYLEFQTRYGETNATTTKRVQRMCRDIAEAALHIEARRKYYAADTTPKEAEEIDKNVLSKKKLGRPRGSR